MLCENFIVIGRKIRTQYHFLDQNWHVSNTFVPHCIYIHIYKRVNCSPPLRKGKTTFLFTGTEALKSESRKKVWNVQDIEGCMQNAVVFAQ